MNEVCMSGKLTCDPIIVDNGNDEKFARFNIEIEKSRRNKNNQLNQSFPTIYVYGNDVDIVEKNLRENSTVFIIGEIATDVYKYNDGEAKYATYIDAISITC